MRHDRTRAATTRPVFTTTDDLDKPARAAQFRAQREAPMANTDSALIIEWGMPTPGRETKALEEFFSHVQWWTELKAKGTINEFRIYGASNGQIGVGAGFVILEGSVDQIQKFSASDEFRRSISRVSLITQSLHIRQLDTNDTMMKRMQTYGTAVKEMGI
jgi:hypothetical protein